MAEMDVNLELRREVASAIHTRHGLVRDVIERMRPVEREPHARIDVVEPDRKRVSIKTLWH